MKSFLLCLVALSLHAQETSRPDALITSDAVLVASDIGDWYSSRGLYELNPIAGRGHFGARQTAISLSLTGAAVLIEWPLVKKWPQLQRVFTYVNLGVASFHGWAIFHNERQ